MKKLCSLLLGLIFYSFSAFSNFPPPYCTDTWNYCSTHESADIFIDAAIENCCAGSSFQLLDLCGGANKYIIITSDGPNSSC